MRTLRSHRTPFLRILAPLLAAFLFLPAASEANGPNGDRITIAVACPDGVVDKDWTLKVEVTDANGNVIGTVTQSVPTHTTAQAAADGLKEQISRKLGIAGVKREETTHRLYQNKLNQAEDLVLPAGYCIGKVMTMRGNSVAAGHLPVYRGDDRLNNKRTSKSASLERRAAGTDRDEEPLRRLLVKDALPPADSEPVSEPLETLTVAIDSFDADSLGVELILFGTDVDGAPFEAIYLELFSYGTPVELIAESLTAFAQSHGMAVSHPGPGAVTLEPGPAGLTIDAWWFTAYPEGLACEAAPTPEDDVTFPDIGVTFWATATP